MRNIEQPPVQSDHASMHSCLALFVGENPSLTAIVQTTHDERIKDLPTYFVIDVFVAEKHSPMTCKCLMRHCKPLLSFKLQVPRMMNNTSKVFVSSSDPHRETLVFPNGSEELGAIRAMKLLLPISRSGSSKIEHDFSLASVSIWCHGMSQTSVHQGGRHDAKSLH